MGAASALGFIYMWFIKGFDIGFDKKGDFQFFLLSLGAMVYGWLDYYNYREMNNIKDD